MVLGTLLSPFTSTLAFVLVAGCGASDCVVTSSEAVVSSTPTSTSTHWGEAVLI